MDNVPVAHIPTAQQALDTEQRRLAGAVGPATVGLVSTGGEARLGWNGEEHPAPDSK
jgi:hypothetical protein